jgi:hypothetical protein
MAKPGWWFERGQASRDAVPIAAIKAPEGMRIKRAREVAENFSCPKEMSGK